MKEKEYIDQYLAKNIDTEKGIEYLRVDAETFQEVAERALRDFCAEKAAEVIDQ